MAQMPASALSYSRFRNLIPVRGYDWLEEWTDLPRQAGASMVQPPFLIMQAKLDGEDQPRWRSTFPLVETPGLFRTFMKTKVARTDILAFANQHGCLDADHAVALTRTGEVVSVCALERWQREIHAIQVANHLAECVANRPNHLARYFRWKPSTYEVSFAIGVSNGKFFKPDSFIGGIPALPFNCFSDRLATPQSQDDMRRFQPGAGWEHGEFSGPARLAVNRIVNERLRIHCHPQLYLDESGKHVGMLTPANLLGCLWLQFYQEVTGQQKLRQCSICHKEMDVAGNRSHKVVHTECSRRERQRRWRQKKLDQQTIGGK
jgi:hypothetical protein